MHTRRAHEETESDIESTEADAERDSDADDVKVTEYSNGVHMIEPVDLEPTDSKIPPKTFLELQKERKQRRQETFARKADGPGREQANTGDEIKEEDGSGNQVINKHCLKNVRAFDCICTVVPNLRCSRVRVYEFWFCPD